MQGNMYISPSPLSLSHALPSGLHSVLYIKLPIITEIQHIPNEMNKKKENLWDFSENLHAKVYQIITSLE